MTRAMRGRCATKIAPGPGHSRVLALGLSRDQEISVTVLRSVYMGRGSRWVDEWMSGKAERPYGWAGLYPVCAKRGYAEPTTPTTHVAETQSGRAPGAFREGSGRAA